MPILKRLPITKGKIKKKYCKDCNEERRIEFFSRRGRNNFLCLDHEQKRNSEYKSWLEEFRIAEIERTEVKENTPCSVCKNFFPPYVMVILKGKVLCMNDFLIKEHNEDKTYLDASLQEELETFGDK